MMISHPPPHLQTCQQITSSSSSRKTLLANTKARTRSRSRCKFGQEAFSWEKIDAQSRRNTFRHHHLNHYHHLWVMISDTKIFFSVHSPSKLESQTIDKKSPGASQHRLEHAERSVLDDFATFVVFLLMVAISSVTFTLQCCSANQTLPECASHILRRNLNCVHLALKEDIKMVSSYLMKPATIWESYLHIEILPLYWWSHDWHQLEPWKIKE